MLTKFRGSRSSTHFTVKRHISYVGWPSRKTDKLLEKNVQYIEPIKSTKPQRNLRTEMNLNEGQHSG